VHQRGAQADVAEADHRLQVVQRHAQAGLVGVVDDAQAQVSLSSRR
jgi:hypothetical protein